MFTVCDQAADEACPVWPGRPGTGHWGIEGLSHEDRGEIWQRGIFAQALRLMKNRVTAFSALQPASLERSSLTAKVREIGQIEGASSLRFDIA